MGDVIVNLGIVDWRLLAAQKADLERLAPDGSNEAVEGILCLLDHIQDEAERLGHPVYGPDAGGRSDQDKAGA